MAPLQLARVERRLGWLSADQGVVRQAPCATELGAGLAGLLSCLAAHSRTAGVGLRATPALRSSTAWPPRARIRSAAIDRRSAAVGRSRWRPSRSSHADIETATTRRPGL